MMYPSLPLASVDIAPAIFTIETKYFKATATRGSLVKASLPNLDGRQATTFSVSIGYHATGGDPHDNAAYEWFNKFHNKFNATNHPNCCALSQQPKKLKLLKVATKTGFLYTIVN